MWFTVDDLLSMPIMNGAGMIAGQEGLGRNIRSVTVLDAPDAPQWLQGHELALTSTFPLIKRQDDLATFIEELVSRNVAGLGVKLNRYMKKLPAEMVACADALAFPIIQIPDQIAWIEIISPILKAVLDSDARYLIRSEEIRGQFTRLLFSGAKLEQLIGLLHTLLEQPVFLVTSDARHCVTVPANNEALDAVLALLQNEAVPAEPIARCPGVLRKRQRDLVIVYTGLDQSEAPHASIVLQEHKEPVDLARLQCLVHARDVIFMGLMQHRTWINLEQEKHNSLIYALTDASTHPHERQKLLMRARRSGLFHHEQYFVAALALHHQDEQAHQAVLAQFPFLFETEKVITASAEPGSYLLFIPDDGRATLEDTAQRVQQYMAKLAKTRSESAWHAGLSRPTPVQELHHALKQAEYALHHSLKHDEQGEIRLHDETGLEQLLADSVTPEQAARYIDDWLGPLIAHDARGNTQLLPTLRAFLNNHGAYRETARELQVHHNTVRYRMSRIHALTRRRSLNPQVYLQYHVALILYDVAY